MVVNVSAFAAGGRRVSAQLGGWQQPAQPVSALSLHAAG